MRKTVKNGFIEVTESLVPSTFHNPSTHDDDTVMKKQWTFTPNMLPDDADMPRNPEEWQREFKRIGATLPAISTRNEGEFDTIVEQCTKAIDTAYKSRYDTQESTSEKALNRLGFQ